MINNYIYDDNFNNLKSIRLVASQHMEKQEISIIETKSAYVAAFEFDGEVNITVISDEHISPGVKIRPLSRKIESGTHSNMMSFKMTRPEKLSVEIDNKKPLFIFAYPIEEDKPSKQDENILYYEAGKIYDEGVIHLKDNQTLYIEGGAVVRGIVRSKDSKNVKICGRGILDGCGEGPCSSRLNRKHTLLFIDGENISIKDITIIEPPSWILVLMDCVSVQIEGINEIGTFVSTDGIDIVSSQKVTVRNCFINNNDDCVVIKAGLPYNYRDPENGVCVKNVEDILVEDCIFKNEGSGNAMEIGFELRIEKISNIVFRNCDVLSVHGYGSPISIHNSDIAYVENVLFEDIRIEHCYDRLIDIRVQNSQYSKSVKKGCIKNITMRNINLTTTVANSSRTTSLISGLNEESTVENVTIQDFYIDGKKAENIDDLWIHYNKYVNNINVI